MANDRRKEVARHLTEEELDENLREADSARRLRRVGFVKNLYRGDTVAEAAAREGRSESTGDRWADAWNEGGLDALMPDFGGGRPPKLDERDRERFLDLLRADQPWDLREIQRLLDEEFGVEYHPDYLVRVLRDLGLSYSGSHPPRDDPASDGSREGSGGWRFDDRDR